MSYWTKIVNLLGDFYALGQMAEFLTFSKYAQVTLLRILSTCTSIFLLLFHTFYVVNLTKHFKIVIYDSRDVLTRKLPILRS